MSRLKNLYTNLITNRRPEVEKVVSDDFVGVSSRRS